MKEIILASASRRRSRILSECRIDHRVVITEVEEDSESSKDICNIVIDNASKKAEAARKEEKNAIIIAADTLVVHGESILGKPNDEGAARKMLKNFSANRVEVYTGLCVLDSSRGQKACGYDITGLVVKHLEDDKIEKYFKLLGPYDKAGGFSIEGVGSLVFDNIQGSYFNVLGLPMIKLASLLAEIDIDILDYVSK